MRRPATWLARRPSVWPAASTTRQRLSISAPLRLYVFICFIVEQSVLVANLYQAEPAGRRRQARRPWPDLADQALEFPRREPAPAHFHQRPHDATHLLGEEGVGLHVHQDAAAASPDLRPRHAPAGALR